MSLDLHSLPPVPAANPILARQHAIYLEAQRSDRRIRRPRNVADLLERGHRSKNTKQTAHLVDVIV